MKVFYLYTALSFLVMCVGIATSAPTDVTLWVIFYFLMVGLGGMGLLLLDTADILSDIRNDLVKRN